jgi:gliding motility-associated-like protein
MHCLPPFLYFWFMKLVGKLFLIFYLGTGIKVFSQNLVPNYSFENTISCTQWYLMANPPPPPGPITNWFTPTASTADWFATFNTCGQTAPLSAFGFQFARTGNAYCGFGVSTDGSNTREYLSCQLIQPLQQSKRYCVNFYVSPGETLRYFVDGMGAYFSVDTPSCSGNYCFLSYPSQVNNIPLNVLTDTVNWTLISGTFIANGGEKFITLGNFTPDSLNTVDTNATGIYDAAYYFIDDVTVEEMVYDTANARNDITICEGDSIQLGTVQCNGCTYQWYPATGLNDSTVAEPTATPAQTTTYILTLTDTTTIDSCNCKGISVTTDTVTVFVIDNFNVANAGVDKTICKGESVTLGTASCGNCTYQWQPFNDLNSSTTAQPSGTPQQTTAYILVMTDSIPPCMKTSTDTVNVFVNDCPQPELPIEIYNIFTPNGDTKNDVFFIKNLPANSALQIFNRWGGRVYESSNYNNEWDGGGVPDGTYYYILVLPSKENYHGFVEIRR